MGMLIETSDSALDSADTLCVEEVHRECYVKLTDVTVILLNVLSTLYPCNLFFIRDSGPLQGRQKQSDFHMTPTTHGKYARRLYYDPVTKCFVSKCVIQVVMYCYDLISCFSLIRDDTFKDKAFYHMIIIQTASVLALQCCHQVMTPIHHY